LCARRGQTTIIGEWITRFRAYPTRRAAARLLGVLRCLAASGPTAHRARVCLLSDPQPLVLCPPWADCIVRPVVRCYASPLLSRLPPREDIAGALRARLVYPVHCIRTINSGVRRADALLCFGVLAARPATSRDELQPVDDTRTCYCCASVGVLATKHAYCSEVRHVCGAAEGRALRPARPLPHLAPSRRSQVPLARLVRRLCTRAPLSRTLVCVFGV